MAETGLARQIRWARSRRLAACFARLFLEDMLEAFSILLGDARYTSILDDELRPYIDANGHIDFLAKFLHHVSEHEPDERKSGLFYLVLVEPFARMERSPS